MLFSLGLLLGVVLGSGLLALSRRARSSVDAPERPAWPRWTALALGALAATLFVAGIAGATDFVAAVIPAIALPVAGVIFGGGRVALGDRHWQAVVGLALACIPTLFWAVFAIAELVGPRH